MPSRRRPQRGLLDGIDKTLDPFLRWGALVFAIAFLLLATEIVILSFLGDDPWLIALTPIPLLIAWLAFCHWRHR
jgi:hypothetical protein